jgi:hypothetical protein
MKSFSDRTGWTYSNIAALNEAIPDPENPPLMLGGLAPPPPAKFTKYTEDCILEDAVHITERDQNFIEDCDLWDPKTQYITEADVAYIEDDPDFC